MALDKLDAIRKILEDQNSLGSRADSKAVAFLTSLGLFSAFFLTFFKDIAVNFFSVVVVVIYIIASILAMYNIIMTIYPRTRTSAPASVQNGPDPHKAAFFADISRFKTVGDYSACLQEMLKDDETVADVYTKQIYEVSMVTAAKYKYTNRAAIFVMLAVAAEFCLIAYVFANKALG